MNERAIIELEQMYMMLSEEKKKAIDEAIKALQAQSDGDIITALCSLPKIQSSDGQDYVQLYDMLETVRGYLGDCISKTNKDYTTTWSRMKWDRLYSWLNDMRFGIAPDETVTDIDERNVRQAQVDLLDEIMEWMVDPQESEG